MITKEQKLRLGIFLSIATVILIVILAIFIAPKLKSEGDIYSIVFRGISVNGINEGVDVKYQGVKIGKVIQLAVNPDDLSSIIVYVRIKPNFPLKQDMRAKLQYAGITGLKFVEISGGHTETPAIKPGGEISTEKGLGEKAEDIVLNAESVVSALNKILNQENRDKISNILLNVEKTSKVTSDLLSTHKKSIGDAIEKFDQSLNQILLLSQNLTTFSSYLNELKEKALIEKVVKDVNKLLKTINDRFSKEELGKLLADIDKFVDSTDTTIKQLETQFHQIGTELNTTLVKLRESVGNIERFTRDLSEDPTILIRTRRESRSKK